MDGTVGSDPSLGIELYRPIGPTPLFVAPYAGVGRMTFDLIDDDVVVARYTQRLARIGLNAGVNLGAHSDVRIGAYVGDADRVHRGRRPWLPRTAGEGDGRRSVWRLDTQDSPVVPAGGVLSYVRLTHIFSGPDLVVRGETLDVDTGLTQLSAAANRFWSIGPPNRVFLYGGFGTSFDSDTVADQSVLARCAVPARRLRHRRAQGGSLLRCDRWIPQARWPAA